MTDEATLLERLNEAGEKVTKTAEEMGRAEGRHIAARREWNELYQEYRKTLLGEIASKCADVKLAALELKGDQS